MLEERRHHRRRDSRSARGLRAHRDLRHVAKRGRASSRGRGRARASSRGHRTATCTATCTTTCTHSRPRCGGLRAAPVDDLEIDKHDIRALEHLEPRLDRLVDPARVPEPRARRKQRPQRRRRREPARLAVAQPRALVLEHHEPIVRQRAPEVDPLVRAARGPRVGHRRQPRRVDDQHAHKLPAPVAALGEPHDAVGPRHLVKYELQRIARAEGAAGGRAVAHAGGCGRVRRSQNGFFNIYIYIYKGKKKSHHDDDNHFH
jgi:hypothetical protein